MSRIGRLPIELPRNVQVEWKPGSIRVSGPKGELSRTIPRDIAVEHADNRLIFRRPSDARNHRAVHGLTRALVANMVRGVTEGFEKALVLFGVGYRAAVADRKLTLGLGYSHPVEVELPEGIDVQVAPAGTNTTRIVVAGMDKERVGQFAADVRGLRPVEPYKGKGLRYEGERVRRKAGKAGFGSKGK